MKKLKWIILSLVVLVAVGGIGGGLMLKSWLAGVLTRESFVRQIESQWNCRADLGDLTVALWSTPARIELKSLILSKRDTDANAGTAIANRKPVAPGAMLAGANTLVLEADLTELVHRRLHVKRLTITGLNLRNDVSEEKGNLLVELFRKPMSLRQANTTASKTPAAVPDLKPSPSLPPPPNSPPVITAVPEGTAPSPAPEIPASEVARAPGAGKKSAHHAAFQASELGLSVVIDEARIENSSFHENNHLVRTRTDISDLSLTISEVDIDPNDLANHNQCKVVVGARIQSKGRAKIKDENQDVKVADFTFKASSTLRPLNAVTGELEPAGMLDLTLMKGSVFGGTMTIVDVAGKDKGFQNVVKNLGIDISSVVAGGEIEQDMSTTVKLAGPRIEFARDATLLFPEYTVTIGSSSWLNGAEDDHEMQLRLVPGDKLSKTLLDGVEAKGGDIFVKFAQGLLDDGQGHLAFDIVTSGHLAKPKTEFGGKAGAVFNILKGLGK
ncbi:MAG: hypothetical protein JWO89_2851 [Verrucomicrobiaceae bacterium]|nr:hypothetical protein [Verrucomicrobiaceae bacterium]